MSNSVPGKLFFVVIKESDNLRWKYLRFNPSGYKDIGIRKFEFVTKTQFLSRVFMIFIILMIFKRGFQNLKSDISLYYILN